MRTLSSRLSMSCVSRRRPRVPATAPALRDARSAIVDSPSRSSSIEASCAASGVRNSCEMFASTVSRAPAHGFQLRLVPDHLHLHAVGDAGAGDHGRRTPRSSICKRSTAFALPSTRACRKSGTRNRTTAVPLTLQGFGTSPQNRPTASSASTLSSFAACGLRYRIVAVSCRRRTHLRRYPSSTARASVSCRRSVLVRSTRLRRMSSIVRARVPTSARAARRRSRRRSHPVPGATPSRSTPRLAPRPSCPENHTRQHCEQRIAPIGVKQRAAASASSPSCRCPRPAAASRSARWLRRWKRIPGSSARRGLAVRCASTAERPSARPAECSGVNSSTGARRCTCGSSSSRTLEAPRACSCSPPDLQSSEPDEEHAGVRRFEIGV